MFDHREDALNVRHTNFHQHMDRVLTSLSQLIGISIQIYIPLTLSVKLRILSGYFRIFKISNTTKWLIWSGVTIISIFYTITFFVDVFMCKPIGKARYLNLLGKCDGYMDLSQSIRIFNIVSDFYILMIPIPIVIGLAGLSIARKIRIVILFGLGLL